ncbi:MAG: hypothetical protein AAB263_16890 [Planctomycetota bacterium]
MRPFFLLAIAAVLLGGEGPRTGFFTTTFAERYADSTHERMGKRYGWGAPRPEDIYDLTKEEFDVNVPGSYDGSTPWGLVVYINAGKGGNARAYSALLAKHKLIWVGATNVPNERAVPPRWGLALDAVWNMRKQYRIDPRRVYISGFSGGGRCASQVGPTWPELFSGGIYFCGCNAPRLPSDKALSARALAGRYAFMTGSGDFNRPGTQATHAEYKSAGFKHTEYFEQPGLAHGTPSAEWFEKALVFVDRPLLEEAAQLCVQAKALSPKKPYEAAQLYRKVIAEFPIAEASTAEAQTELAALTPTVDGLLRNELTKLGEAPPADKVLALAMRTEGYPCVADVRSLADSVGTKELATITAQSGSSTKGKLEKFLVQWASFPCATAAATAYDGLAAKVLEPLSAQEASKRDKALLKFLTDWQACPSRSTANGLLEADLATELSKLLAIDKPAARNPKLLAFAKNWPGTQAAMQAEAEAAK